MTTWTVVRQGPLSMGFSSQEYWSGLPSPSPEDLSDPGIEPGSPALQTDSLPSELQERSNMGGRQAQYKKSERGEQQARENKPKKQTNWTVTALEDTQGIWSI